MTHLSRTAGILLLVLCAALVAGCTPMVRAATLPTPFAAISRSQPTATRGIPTPEPTATRLIRATQAPPTSTWTPAPTASLPVATARPVPIFTAGQQMNIRSGPGIVYRVTGQLQAGQHLPALAVTSDEKWLEIDFLGEPAWVALELGTLNVGVLELPLATKIPPTPRPLPTALPTATYTPAPTNTPEPTAPPTITPTPWGGFTKAVVMKCESSNDGTYFHGTVFDHGTPANGYRVVFSDQPNGNWSSEPVISGPHAEYWDWRPGYYRHTIGNPPELKAGTWFVWIVDEKGNRISEFAAWRSTDANGDCQEATIDFDK